VRGSAAFSAFSLLTFLLDTVSAFDRSVIFKFREVRGRVGFSFPGASSLSYGATPWWRKKYWEIIADNLSKAGWSWGCVSAIDNLPTQEKFAWTTPPELRDFVPTPGCARFHINLWLGNFYDTNWNHLPQFAPHAGPTDGDEVEVVIRNFEFQQP